jgi:hypothetical protein
LGHAERLKLLDSIGLRSAYHAYQRERIAERVKAGGKSGTETNGAGAKDANDLFDPHLLAIKGGVVSAAGGSLTVDKAVAMEPGKEAETVRWVGDNMVVKNPDLSSAPSTTALWLLNVARESPVDFLRLWTELLKFQRKAEAAAKFTADDGRVLGLMETLLGAAEKAPLDRISDSGLHELTKNQCVAGA